MEWNLNMFKREGSFPLCICFLLLTVYEWFSAKDRPPLVLWHGTAVLGELPVPYLKLGYCEEWKTLGVSSVYLPDWSKSWFRDLL